MTIILLMFSLATNGIICYNDYSSKFRR